MKKELDESLEKNNYCNDLKKMHFDLLRSYEHLIKQPYLSSFLVIIAFLETCLFRYHIPKNL